MKTSIRVYIEPDEVRAMVAKFLADKIANMDKHEIGGVHANRVPGRHGFDAGNYPDGVELAVELEVKQ